MYISKKPIFSINKFLKIYLLLFLLILSSAAVADKNFIFAGIDEKSGSLTLLDMNSVKPSIEKGFNTVDRWNYYYKSPTSVVYAKNILLVDCKITPNNEGLIRFYVISRTSYMENDKIKFHRNSIRDESGVSKKTYDGKDVPLYEVLKKYICK